MRDTLFNAIPRFFRKRFSKPDPTYMRFLPSKEKGGAVWWSFNKETVIEMLKLLGFEKTEVIYHDYRDRDGKKVFQWTIIGERTMPIDQCDYDFDPN